MKMKQRVIGSTVTCVLASSSLEEGLGIVWDVEGKEDEFKDEEYRLCLKEFNGACMLGSVLGSTDL